VNRKEAEGVIREAVPPSLARAAAAYIADESVPAGARMRIDRRDVLFDRAVFLGFIDLEPGRNWGHNCLYVFCNLGDAGVETRSGQFPPQGAQMKALAIGPDVPNWAVIGR